MRKVGSRVVCGFILFVASCGSGTTTSTTNDPCLAAGIDPGEEREIMDGATRDSLYFSYDDERQSVIDACWNGSVSTYQADNCVACVVPLVDYVYAP